MGRLILFYVKMRIHFTCKIELFIHQPFIFLSGKLLVVCHRFFRNSTLIFMERTTPKGNAGFTLEEII